MASLEELILYGRQTGCSDIQLTSGQPTVFRRLGQLVAGQTADDSLEQDARILSLLTPEQKKQLEELAAKLKKQQAARTKESN